MIEEYARHNGHADLLREALDGETGEIAAAANYPGCATLRWLSVTDVDQD